MPLRYQPERGRSAPPSPEHLALPYNFSEFSLPATPQNNDQHYVGCTHDPLPCLVGGVFDGLGATAAGKQAAILAKEAVINMWRGCAQPVINSPAAARSILLEAITAARIQIATHSLPKDPMDATFCAGIGVPQPEGLVLVAASLGNSRCYLVHANNTYECLTLDAGFTAYRQASALCPASRSQQKQWQDIMGRITSMADMQKIADPDLRHQIQEAFVQRHRLWYGLARYRLPKTRELDYAAPEIITVMTRPGDRLLFCTDGIHNNLADSELAALVRQDEDVRQTAATVVGAAHYNSHCPDRFRRWSDDATAVVIEIPSR